MEINMNTGDKPKWNENIIYYNLYSYFYSLFKEF